MLKKKRPDREDRLNIRAHFNTNYYKDLNPLGLKRQKKFT